MHNGVGSNHFWRTIDWDEPWLTPYRARGQAACAALDGGKTVAEALDSIACERRPKLAAGPVRFVAPSQLPERMTYEAFIAKTACVPTRDNLHDLFNGLVWMTFPELKRRLNELQAVHIEQAGVAATRGPLRDALTLFDENAALWQAPPLLADALRRRDWHALFVTHRREWDAALPIVFGHALMEKLVRPRKGITAHVWLGGADAALDDDAALQRKPWLPMPVLGVPGWWPANEDSGFYDDPEVFRR